MASLGLFIKKLGKKFNSGSIGVIAENKEKYISFNIDVIMGLYEDMCRFIAAAAGKIYKLHAERLRELEAPWLSH